MIIGVVLVAILTINFDSGPPGYILTDFVVDGFRFSPLCPVAIRRHQEDSYLNVDLSNNCGQDNNPEPLSNSALYIDRFDEPFTLESLSAVVPRQDDVMTFEARSSRGGVLTQIAFSGTSDYIFTGNQWTDVSWITLAPAGEATSDDHQRGRGWDNIRVATAVKEPSSAILTGIAGFIMFLIFRKRYFSRSY